MRKKLILMVAVFIAGATTLNAQDTIPTLTIDSTLTVGDSAIFNRNVRVEGQTFMGENATAARDFIVEGNAIFNSRVFYPNAPEISGSIVDRDILIFDPVTGAIEKSTLGQMQNAFYSFTCNTVNGVVESPVWNNGPNKIFVGCPEVRVGIGTTTPAYNLDVRGVGYFSNSIRVGNVQTSSYTNAALIEGERNAAHTNPLIRLSVKKTDGTNEVRFKVESDGQVYCTALKVRLTNNIPIPDYVFKPSYKLMPISELKTFVSTNSHLPNIPSEKQIREEGLSIDQMQLKLLEKVEELTLYIIQLSEQNEALSAEISNHKTAFEKELELLKNQLNSK